MTVQGATAHHAVPERNWGPVLHKVFVYTCLVVGTVVIMIPFFWMITTSLKKSGTEFTFPIEWLPNPPRWKNYVDGWTVLPFNRWALNSVRISALAIAGSVISSAIVGFGFGRIRFPGRDALFMLVLATMMLPFPSVIVPLFLLFKRIGWIDTILPLTVPTFFGANAFFIFLLRQFFRTLPLDLDDAARVDGCNTFHVFLRICLPLIRPALGIIFVFSFMHNWNDFLGPLIFLSHTTKYTLALGLRYFQSQYRVEWALMMAVSLIILTPNIVLFFLAQKYYIQGIVVSGVKG
ncbi:MAG: carbohydrate ABC transporter permease [Caldilineaceae bacterium SB0665_bin_21]|nr:carbohydrate ABC transporter permease [Caldilineaceae bacterium SB0665_bin_21]MYA04887.1 carbohydrate ABC transporter permease [Caldilineaceae bacterium SB0664_bin_22]MYC63872.1 carbohydrate ABC transporter permease [Caldilineaceae bacterium SB0661_bin_34]